MGIIVKGRQQKSHSEEVSMVRKRAMKYQIERMEAQTEASLIDLSNEKKPGCLGCTGDYTTQLCVFFSWLICFSQTILPCWLLSRKPPLYR